MKALENDEMLGDAETALRSVRRLLIERKMSAERIKDSTVCSNVTAGSLRSSAKLRILSASVRPDNSVTSLPSPCNSRVDGAVAPMPERMSPALLVTLAITGRIPAKSY
ncbi:hypothetical protein BVJ53_09245 [Lacticaseibacillus chiayiensis]|uniref:Uncharacterized protein n=1 Tax=Lacticaseibacillus chiayiensis TaxID=2100821 RepID=A0A4Q1TUI4_9LACO|nr:hypothetical protein BVJ53_09245 [Lacticaseibacillus chiayiensis]